MITILIGHRGAGKTRLLKRIQEYVPTCDVVDLDDLIEQGEGVSIEELFRTKGEAWFRTCEKIHFESLMYEERTRPLYVAIGAGFQAELPRGVRRIWVRRETDRHGRILLDRPRLEKEKSQLETSRERFAARELCCQMAHHEAITIPEGWDHLNDEELDYFQDRLHDVGGSLTILLENCTAHPWMWFFGRRMRWGIDAFEVRDDLVDDKHLGWALESIPKGKLIVSFRPGAKYHVWQLPEGQRFDWDISLGPVPSSLGTPTIFSVHQRIPGESLKDVFQRFEAIVARHPLKTSNTAGDVGNWSRGAPLGDTGQLATAGPATFKSFERVSSHCKVSVEIESFAELLEGDRWMLEDPEHRSFLPRSKDGRWNWYRRLRKGVIRYNFIREGKGSSLDQPTLFDWLRTPSGTAEKCGSCHGIVAVSPKGPHGEQPRVTPIFHQPSKGFAAILGDPVDHSLSPSEHYEFFKEKGMPVFAIRVTKQDWEEGALGVLQQLGLCYVAITSPLKQLAFSACRERSDAATKLESVNTMAWHAAKRCWVGENTDEQGFREFVKDIRHDDRIAVWGGGALLPMMRKTLPNASFYSARAGSLRDGPGISQPTVLVWATGDAVAGPEFFSSIRRVVDLNYRSDSPGLDYAEQKGISYTSGLIMFREQAKKQREFWESYERK